MWAIKTTWKNRDEINAVLEKALKSIPTTVLAIMWQGVWVCFEKEIWSFKPIAVSRRINLFSEKKGIGAFSQKYLLMLCPLSYLIIWHAVDNACKYDRVCSYASNILSVGWSMEAGQRSLETENELRSSKKNDFTRSMKEKDSLNKQERFL